MSFWKAFAVGFQISMTSAWKRKGIWLGIFCFAFLLFVLFPFCFGAEAVKSFQVSMPSFWIVNEFVSLLSLSILFQAESEAKALDIYCASGSSSFALLFAKAVFGFVFMCSLQIFLLFFWFLFFDLRYFDISSFCLHFLPIIVLFDAGSATVGALATCLLMQTLAKEILLPILYFPLQMVVFLAANTLSLAFDPGRLLGGWSQEAWWSILFGFPIIFLTLGFLFDSLLFQE